MTKTKKSDFSIGNKTGLNKDKDIPKLYTYLIQFERKIKTGAGNYNFDDSSFKKYCSVNDIRCIKSMAEAEIKKKSKYTNYFFFHVHKNSISSDDVAHHLLRHIRNSIAHALVSKIGNDYYLLKDKNKKGNPSMEAKIRIDLFDNFIIELEKTRFR